MELRTVVVEDNPRYRASLETFLRHAPGFALADSFGSAVTAVAAARDASERGDGPGWDLVLMDVELPGMSGIEATGKLKQLLGDVSIVILTVFEEPSVILEAIAAGADGYLLKRSTTREMQDQLRSIAAGGAPLTAGVARTVLDLVRKVGPQQSPPGSEPPPARLGLTEREQDVLRCLVQGMAYKQAADHLGVRLDTVRTHVTSVYRKLQVHSVAEAVSRAVRERLV